MQDAFSVGHGVPLSPACWHGQISAAHSSISTCNYHASRVRLHLPTSKVFHKTGLLAASWSLTVWPVPFLEDEIVLHLLPSRISSPEHPSPPLQSQDHSHQHLWLPPQRRHHTAPCCRCLLPHSAEQHLTAFYCSPGMSVGAQTPCPWAEITGCQRSWGVPASLPWWSCPTTSQVWAQGSALVLTQVTVGHNFRCVFVIHFYRKILFSLNLFLYLSCARGNQQLFISFTF